MKCALIMPPWLPEDIFPTKTARSQVNYWQPLGVLYVAASLLKAGHEVRFFDGSFLSSAEILERVRSYNPRFVGIYSNTPLWKKAQRVAMEIKNISSAFIAVGGPYPIARGKTCLEKCASIDCAVTGEGEVTAVEIVDRLERGEELSGIMGTVYRRGSEIVTNPPRPLIQDLDSIPFPARELLEDPNLYVPPPGTYRKKPVAIVMTSRGCDAQCIYCFQYGERKIRYRSVENVMQEIELCLKQGYKEIRFLDDTFCGDYERAMRIVEEIEARGLEFSWYVSARVNQVDKPLLKAFKDAGCWAILFGAESGVQKNLNAIKKGITLEQTGRAVRSAKEVGLKICTPFIFGIPGETFQEGLQTIEFACELDADIANFHTLAPFPGTELYDNAVRYGTISGDVESFTFEGSAFVPYTMTKEEIEKLCSIAFKKFYSRPKFILRKILEIRSVEDFKAISRGLRSLFWMFKAEKN